jgi:hypothetical protein
MEGPVDVPVLVRYIRIGHVSNLRDVVLSSAEVIFFTASACVFLDFIGREVLPLTLANPSGS